MKPNHNIEDEKWALLAMSIYDDDLKLTAEEKNKIAEELLSEPEEKNQLLRTVEEVDLYFNLKKYPVEKALEKVQNKIQKRSQSKITRFRKLFSNSGMRYAAAVLVAVLLSVAGYEMVANKAESPKMLEISSADQVVKSFKLPDGTLVSLNSDTQLKYPKRFGKETREVTIEGEAFFEVKPNKKIGRAHV